MTLPISLLLVGCGKMGQAMLQGWRARDPALRISVIDPAPPPLSAAHNVKFFRDPAQLPATATFTAIVIAIKPQQLTAALPLYQKFSDSLFLSIAAGQTLGNLAKLLGNNVPIVRAMPNLPASIGQGITVAVANSHVTSAQRQLAHDLLTTIGSVEWVETEHVMDAVTALSGSGPAYLFALTEAMAQAGEQLGLAPTLAAKLARQTVIGSAALLNLSELSPVELRHAVTSPGGTTEAALKILLAKPGLQGLLKDAMQAASERSRTLASTAT